MAIPMQSTTYSIPPDRTAVPVTADNYDPDKVLFEKTWVIPASEKVS